MAIQEPEVIRAIFYPTGTYNPEYYRGYITKNTGDRELSDIILDQLDDGGRLMEPTLSSVVNDIIEIDMNSNDRIEIDNGWDTERFGFILVVLEHGYGGYRRLNILTGYTDHADISLITRQFDPDMRLYVNNSTTISETDIDTGRGSRRRRTLNGNDLVLRGRKPRRGGGMWGGEDGDITIRPADIFYRDSSSGIITALGGSDKSIDGRNRFTGDFIAANRRHNHITSYITDTLRTGIAAKRAMTIADDDNNEDHIDRRIREDASYSSSEYAASVLSKTSFDTASAVYRRFADQCAFDRTASITVDELEAALIWPDGVTKLYTPEEARTRQGSSRVTAHAGDGETWQRSDEVGIIANIVSRSIPAIMLSQAISSCNVFITNDTDNGLMTVSVTSELGIVEGMDVSRSAEIMEDIIFSDLANVISRNNEYIITVNVDINITTDQIIDIIWEDEEEVRFYSPLFCDGLISPQKTNKESAIADIVEDITDIIDDLSETI